MPHLLQSVQQSWDHCSWSELHQPIPYPHPPSPTLFPKKMQWMWSRLVVWGLWIVVAVVCRVPYLISWSESITFRLRNQDGHAALGPLPLLHGLRGRSVSRRRWAALPIPLLRHDHVLRIAHSRFHPHALLIRRPGTQKVRLPQSLPGRRCSVNDLFSTLFDPLMNYNI